MDIIVIPQARRELKKAPKKVLIDAYALFDELSSGKSLGMPISKPLPKIAKGLHELRLSFSDGDYRIFYVLKVGRSIYVIHAAAKKTQQIDKKTTKTLKMRIKDLGI